MNLAFQILVAIYTSKAMLLSVREGGTGHSITGLGSNGPGRILGRNAKFAGQARTGRAGN